MNDKIKKILLIFQRLLYNKLGDNMTKIFQEDYEDIKELYKTLSINKIARKYDVTSTTISRILKSLNVEKIERTSRKYFIKEDYFITGLNPKKARLLGLIATDGCLIKTKNNQYRIKFSSKDKELNIFIQEQLGGNIYEENNCFHNYISSEKIFYDLIDFGITERKSLSLNFKWEKIENYEIYFLLGCIEGDGHIGFYPNKKSSQIQISIATGCINFAQSIKDKFPDFRNIYTKKFEKSYVNYVSITSHTSGYNISKILENASNDCGMLQRKYDNIKDIINWYNEKYLLNCNIE